MRSATIVKQAPLTPELEQHAPVSIQETAELNHIRKILRDLDRFGLAQDLKIPTPNIVMIGDQSSGKSSLVEAISETVKPPRDQGTCTRVPLEVSLTKYDGPWTASISLLQKWQPAGPGTKKKEKLHPWAERQPPIFTHFLTITDPEKLTNVIRWAQAALLNPNDDPVGYAEKAANEVPPVVHQGPFGFSPNPIQVDIKAENLPELSFKDLPGIIAQASAADGGKHAVELIKEIAKRYASEENTLIVLVISMESDIDTSNSSALVSALGSKRNCVAVLTKPDRMANVNVQQWTDVLGGLKYHQKLGYFVTKQPSSPDVDYLQARLDEAAFFAKSKWRHPFVGKVVDLDSRLGTLSLQKTLALEHEIMVRHYVPKMFEGVRTELLKVQKRLDELPVTKDPISAIHRMVSEFKNGLQTMTSPSVGPSPLLSDLKLLKDKFGDALIKKFPLFRVGADLYAPGRTALPARNTPQGERFSSRDTIVLDGGEDDDNITTNRTPISSRPSFCTPVSSSKRKRDLLDTPGAVSFRPRDIYRILEDWDFRGKSSRVNPIAIEHILHLSIDWESEIGHFFSDLERRFSKHLLRLQQHVCNNFNSCGIDREMGKIVKKLIHGKLSCSSETSWERGWFCQELCF
jgi:Dynamin family/Dynamin central region